jgi:hypothetical protein
MDTGNPSLRVGEIISSAFDLYRRQATQLWTIVAIIVFGFLAAIVTVGALSKCLLDAYTGHPTDWRHSVRFAADRLGPLAWLAILSGVLLTIAYVLIVIPGIYLTVCWLVAVPVLMFEGLGGFGALRRSRELVRGHWWTIFGAVLVGIVSIIAVSIVLGLILGGIANSGHISVILVVSGLGRIVAAVVTYPIVAAISAVVYIELRRRNEGVAPESLVGAGEPSLPV